MKSRKGFTLVELLVVIAILAILATASIIGFTAFTRKAQVSNDSELVTQLNKYAQAASVSKDFKTVTEMRDELIESGFELANLKLEAEKQDYVIGFDIAKDRFVLLKKGEAAEGYTVDKEEDVFAFVKNEQEAKFYEDKGYSLYLQMGYDKPTLEVKTGVDVGENAHITSISYDRHEVTNPADHQEVVIRTKGDMCVLNVNAPSDHVDHYGYAKEVNVIDVNSVNSYHEYGVVNELKVSSGKIVIENTAVVFDLSATTESTATVTKVAGANVMASEISTVAASETFEINSLAQLEAFRDATNSGNNFAGKTINLNVDITLNGPWTPISNYWRKTDFVTSDKWFAGTFNGNNHTIYGLSNVGMEVEKINTGYNVSTPAGNTEFVYGFFASINGAIVRDLKFINVNIVRHETLLADAIGAAIGYYLTPDDVISGNEGYNVSNITVSGTINGYDNTGSIIGYVGNNDGTFKIKNCTLTNGSIVQAIRKTGGIVGSNTVMTSVFDTCKNLGNVSSIGTYDNEATKSNGDKDFSSGNNTYSCGGMCVTNTSYTRNITFTNCESNAVSSASASNKVGQMSYVMNGNKVIINNGAYVYTPSPAGWTKDGDAWTSD